MDRVKKQAGLSTIEYMMLIMLIAAALTWMKPYIQRAFQGHLKPAGDTFGMGRQYQVGHTVDCAFMQINSDTGVWYDDVCYQQKAASSCRPGDLACEDAARIACKQDYCCDGGNCT